MPKFLTSAQVALYHETGFLSPIDLMSEDDAAKVLQQLESAESDYPEHINADNRYNPHLVCKFLDDLAFHPILLDVVEDLIGPDFSLWGSVLFVKEPGSKHYVSWHQDATYMGMSSNHFVTPWIALSPSTRETGCMTMIPGSHLQSIKPHEETFAENNILTRGQVVRDVDESTGVDLILRPGQMSLHHGEIVHGSQPNQSANRRVGFALQSYMPNDIRQQLGENQWIHARGARRPTPETVELQRPTANMEPAAIQQREAVDQNFRDILYHGARKRQSH